MDVPHSVEDHLSDCFKLFKVAHRAYCVSLDKDVTISQKLKRFKSLSIWPDKSLPPLDKLFFIPDDISNLYNFHKHVIILHNFDSLWEWDRSSQELDQISGSDDAIWVPSLTSGFHRHGALDQIKLTSNLEFFQLVLNQRPDLLHVLFPVLREKTAEARFIDHAIWIMLWLEFLNSPFVHVRIVVPWLRLSEFVLLSTCLIDQESARCMHLCLNWSVPFFFF